MEWLCTAYRFILWLNENFGDEIWYKKQFVAYLYPYTIYFKEGCSVLSPHRNVIPFINVGLFANFFVVYFV